jgi:hypothetical protein
VIGITLIALIIAILSAPAAQAHNTSHCFHGDIPNGGWYTQYNYHYWYGNTHYNVYTHYLYGTLQHPEYNVCN